MTFLNWISLIFEITGTVFFVTGTIGLIRFPDVYCRLHAITKADNLGLGFIAIAIILQLDSWQGMAKVMGIWLLILMGSATTSHLIAKKATELGVPPWISK